MVYFKPLRFIASAILLTIFAVSCGSSGGESGMDRSLTILEPAQDSVFAAGAKIPYVLSVTGFTLREPLAMPPATSGGIMQDMGMPDHHTKDAGHPEGLGENPTATEGHYHIYLDDRSGVDEHKTAWTPTGEFPLPADIAKGMHSLRFELRDNEHRVIGTDDSEAILFFEVR